MIQEGCDAGLMLGTITDENVVARPAGKVARCIVASPALVKSRPALKGPSDLKSWPWLTLSSNQFGGSKVVTLFNHKRSRQELRLSPLLISEGVSSLREAALGGWAWLLLVSGWYGMISGRKIDRHRVTLRRFLGICLLRVAPCWRFGSVALFCRFEPLRASPIYLAKRPVAAGALPCERSASESSQVPAVAA
jgi:hypothetical protein